MKPSAIAFDQERAAAYDKQAAVWAPTRDALHLLMRVILAELPDQARVLCVGAGTGAELLFLAQAFPQWTFTAVDPAGAMLDICRQKAQHSGILSRCTFHQGYLDSLPQSEPFDAATCLLVSQFLLEPEERRGLFREMASRLRAGAILISSDIAADMSSASFESFFQIWLRMQRESGVPQEAIEKMRGAYESHVAIVAPSQVQSIIASGGFESPILFHQALLIHAWFARRA